MTLLLSSQNFDVSPHLGNLLKGFRNIGRDEGAGKYGCEGRVAFYCMFRELRHYIVTLERGPQNFCGIIHSGKTQLILHHHLVPIQVIKHMLQLVG